MTSHNRRKILPYGSEVLRGIYRTSCKVIAGGGMYGESHKQQLASARRSIKHSARQFARKYIKDSLRESINENES